MIRNKGAYDAIFQGNRYKIEADYDPETYGCRIDAFEKASRWRIICIAPQSSLLYGLAKVLNDYQRDRSVDVETKKHIIDCFGDTITNSVGHSNELFDFDMFREIDSVN